MNENFLVELHLANNEKNYNFILEQGETLLMVDNFDLKTILKNNCIFENEKINWDEVDAEILREDISTLQRGE